MPENKVFMDTNIFTDIVNDIKYSTGECILDETPLDSVKVWQYMDVGLKMEKILKKVYKSSKEYRKEASESLPRAFLTLRDSMIRVDDVASKSIKVDMKK
ncbi:hypothetical protein [Butyrivibrio sp. INlla21]|uniref:hypothetical protein n=1 Tax=Butyrivibrio sp. INlla21 TaxID=1520811 RepID=UPI0008E13738|nr:hypothetical protein [Butyrivibrio sp. INlla21]SFV04288.1 hypothetical protein SAMN02910342_03195 [Butyrivibrio sp. INlla21]